MKAIISGTSTPGKFKALPIKYIELLKEFYDEKKLLQLIRDNPHKRLADCLEVIFKQKKLSILEVGVNEGTLIQNLLKRRPNTMVYAIEPNPKIIAKLREKMPENVQIFNFGLGESDGNSTLYITKATRNSSQFKPNPNYQKLTMKRDGMPGDVFDVTDEVNFKIVRGDDFMAQQYYRN